MTGHIPSNLIDEVRSAVNIVDIISQYVSLTKKGKDYVGLCPFHQEKTPSFTVSESKQFFKCFGCGKGGNVFKFLMDKENISFPESVISVAKIAHITIPGEYNNDAIYKKNPIKQIYSDATEFYHHILLTTKLGEVALKYVQERELTSEIISHFKIGYAPKADNILYIFLKQKNYSQDLLEQSGLFIKNEKGKLLDRFRDRLMFPLCDELGDPIAFSGRRISNDSQIAKYVNSPETPLFTKSKLLYHFSEAKHAVNVENHLILYEGYMDVISAYKCGIKTGVASMGTSLTSQQVYMLRRVTPNIIINYDGDDPGQHAMERAIKLFNYPNINLGIVSLPENLDPDEYVKKYGPEKYVNEVKAAITSTEFLLQRMSKKYNLFNDRDKLDFINESIALIAKNDDPIEIDIYIQKLAQKLQVSVESLKARLLREQRKIRTAINHQKQIQALYPTDEVTPKQLDNVHSSSVSFTEQKRLLFLFIHNDNARLYLLTKKFIFPNESYQQLANLWLSYLEKNPNPNISGFADFIPKDLQSIIVNMELTDMPYTFSEGEIDDQIASLIKQKTILEMQRLYDQIKVAQQKNDSQLIIQLTQKIIELKRKII